MTARALTLAIRLLSAAAIGVTLGATTGCLPFFFGCGDTGWQPQTMLALGVDADLEALTYEDTGYTYLAVGTAGTVVNWSGTEGPIATFTVGTSDLHAVASFEGAWWVAGDGGSLFSSTDSGQTWVPADLGGTSANLRAITNVNGVVLVVGDEIVLARDAAGIWAEVTPPDTGWGELRGVFWDGARTYAVGRAGVVWSTEDPIGTWTAENLDVDTDLFDVGRIGYDVDAALVVVGATGTLVIRDSSGAWTVVDTGVSADLIDFSGSSVINSEGVVHEVGTDGSLVEVATLAGMRALYSNSPMSGLLAVGADGVSKSRDYFECIGGRPFMIEGQMQTASLDRSDAWCLAEPEPESLPLSTELAERLAAAWAEDGLYEHASVASFARFMLELLALGAPPALLHAAQAGIHDELHHAELCFALARRFGGTPLGPGPLAIPELALARTGDPVATALALLDEGCINESVAACEAADALEACVDAEVRATLEIIAADERRHATAAWAALRWLLDRYGEVVREPLRRRVAELAVAPSRPLAARDPLESALAAYGRSNAERRANVQRRVLGELVLPLARAMLSADPSTIAAARM